MLETFINFTKQTDESTKCRGGVFADLIRVKELHDKSSGYAQVIASLDLIDKHDEEQDEVVAVSGDLTALNLNQ